jgi:hypothetical protein
MLVYVNLPPSLHTVSPALPPPLLKNHSLFRNISNVKSRADTVPSVHFLARHFPRTLNLETHAGLVVALHAGAASCSERRLIVWARRRGDVEIVAEGCGGAGAGYAGEVPCPGSAVGGAGGPAMEMAARRDCEGLGEHDQC